MNYFEFYCGDYLKDTGRLSLIDHGAYLRLLLTYYGEEQPLPSGFPELYDIAVATTEEAQAAVRKVADRYFPIGTDGLRHNKRADEDIEKARKRIETARKNGAKGGRKASKHAAQSRDAQNPQGTHRVAQRGGLRGNPERTHRGTQSGEALHTPSLNLEQKLPTTSGDEAAPPPDPIFGTGLDFLIRKAVPEKAARSFLGLLRKEIHDDLTVSELLTKAEQEDVSDPCAWLRAAAKARINGNPRAQPVPQTSKSMQAIQTLRNMTHERKSQPNRLAVRGTESGNAEADLLTPPGTASR